MRYLALLILFLFTACEPQSGNDNEAKTEIIEVVPTTNNTLNRLPLVADKKIKNVIFVIGDGNGLAQITSGQYELVGKDGWLQIQRPPITGIVRTPAADNLITDSAAGATAYSCGVKTNNGMIGQLPDGTHCKTILEIVQEMGYSTALVATSTITHATPASYASHVVSRQMQDVIAEQYLTSNVDVLLGGGLEFFIPQTEEGSSRKDDRNLLPEFEENGYQVLKSSEDLMNSNSDKLLGLFDLKGLPSENRAPTLSEMTSKALSIVEKNDTGFFMMVEGSQIDWAGHANDVDYVKREVQDFDDALKVIFDFAENDGETLVIITADHETGGMTIQRSIENSTKAEIYWTTDYHTGTPIPLMAYGPHAVQFSGWHENTTVGIKVAELLGIKDFPTDL